jgi:hypothetical protein
MAKTNSAPFSTAESKDTVPRAENVSATKDVSIGNGLDDKGDALQVEQPSYIEEAAALPIGTIDPVYEAKARVLNKAVRFPRVHVMLF